MAMNATRSESEQSPGKLGRNRLRFRFTAVFVVAAAIVLVVLASPLFAVTQIDVTGNAAVSTQRVLELAGVSQTDSMFSFMASDLEGELVSEPYIKYAEVTKTYPGTVNISITERTPRAYIKCINQDAYILIDGDGMVLEFAAQADKLLPVVVGLDYESFSVGDYLNTESAAYGDIVMISRVLTKYEIADVVKIDVSDRSDIHLYVNNIDVYFGSIDDADTKIQYLKGIMHELPADERGFLYLNDIDSDPYFSRLK